MEWVSNDISTHSRVRNTSITIAFVRTSSELVVYIACIEMGDLQSIPIFPKEIAF